MFLLNTRSNACFAIFFPEGNKSDTHMSELFYYVGPKAILDRMREVASGTRIVSPLVLREWLRSTGQRPNKVGLFQVTFVIDEEGFLRVADRGSEHIACSGLRPVLSAGEMFVRVLQDSVEIEEVSNQSTGFCPSPTSWNVVSIVLDNLGIRHPGRFTSEITFRLCTSCGQRNIVKDNYFSCDVCGADLPPEWNFHRTSD